VGEVSRPRVVVLGGDAPEVPGALRERAGATLAEIEALLEPAPDVVVAGGSGERCLFRASLALERGVRTVVVPPGALVDAWLADLAARGAETGAAVVVPDGRGYRRVRARRSEELEPGAPSPSEWAIAAAAARGDPAREAALGLEAAAAPPAGGPLLEDDRAAGLLPARLEELAFAAGLKPVLYLVLDPAEAARVRARFPAAQAVSRGDRVSVEPLTGARAGGGAAVAHLFLAAERRDAERAAALWAEGSTRHVRELGALMGYPACCTAAFAALSSRRNNAALVYATAARTRALAAEFHPLLNQPVARLAPFTPCSFGCRRAIGWAERVLTALAPELAAGARRALARPVLYLDELRAIVFEGARADDASVTFSAARWLPREEPGADETSRHARALFGWALAGAGRLRLAADALEVERGGSAPLRIARGPLRLGVLLPFGSGA
jgi:hypothetical protein